MKEFWTKYIKANELERARILETLPLIKFDKDNLFIKNMTITILQSYLDDLIEVMKRSK
jgi:hypothetical protein